MLSDFHSQVVRYIKNSNVIRRLSLNLLVLRNRRVYMKQMDPCLGAASTPQIGDPWRRCKRWTVAWYISYVKRSVPDGKNWAMSWDGSFWNLKAWDIHWIVQVSRLDCYGRYFGCVMALWCSHKNQCARRTARRKRHIVSQLSFGFLTCSKGLKLMGCDWVVWRWDLGLRSNDFVCEGVTAQRWMVLKFWCFHVSRVFYCT